MDHTAAIPLALPDRCWDLLLTRCRLTPDRTMLLDDRGRALTFDEFRQAAEGVAAALTRRGVGEGTVVSWQLPTSLEGAVLMAALCRLDAVQNPIIPILRDADVDFIVEQIGTDLLVVPGVWRGFDHAAMAEKIAGRHGCAVLVCDLAGRTGDDLALPFDDPAELAPFGAAGSSATPPVRWIYYSSGTTAAPKGAQHTDPSVMAGSNAIVVNVGLRVDDLSPMAFPLTHIGGISFISAQLRVPVRVMLIEAFDPADSPRAMAAAGATILGSAVPFFHAYLAAQRQHGSGRLFPDLRLVMQGGAPCPPELHYEVKRELGGIGILSGWGLTEFPIATYTSPTDTDEILATTVGRPGPEVEVRAVRTDGRDAGPGEEGELYVKGPQVMVGYVDHALDAAAFDDRGFFRTGDLGTIDTDRCVRITGRVKDVIIRNAENISAVEVEDVLYRHPHVADVAVIGVPDARTGERCCAVVVLAKGALALTLSEVAAHCQEAGLARHKTPERLEIVTSIPRNSMGKILKQQLREQFH
jgi:acyl-CoA synthetase (AMP-forming)/AMP-acid ligase II